MKLVKLLLTLKNISLKQLFWQVFRFFRNTSSIKNLLEFNFWPRFVLILNCPYWCIDGDNIVIFGSKLKQIKSKLPCDITHDYLNDFSYNYLDFIFSSELSFEDVVRFIDNYPNEGNRYEWHPYTVSKRLINLIVFCVHNYKCIPNDKIKNFECYASEMYGFLQENIEFHLGANHVLTNYAALSIAQVFIKEHKTSDSVCYIDSYIEQYTLQFSKDIHYERSVAYSRQLLSEFLLVAQFHDELKSEFFYKKNSKIIAAISAIDSLGEMFGDNILEQSPNIADIVNQFFHVYQCRPLGKEVVDKYDIEGYCFFDTGVFKVLADAGEPSPKFNPGHAHDSTGALSISVGGIPLIVNGIVSTYERCGTRTKERSRLAYSKPQNLGVAQDTWASFRVASRRKPQLFPLKNGFMVHVETSKNGFQRTVSDAPRGLTIIDKSLNSSSIRIISQFIVGPDFDVGECIKNKIHLRQKSSATCILVTFDIETKVRIKKVFLGVGYGKVRAYDALIFESNGRQLDLIIKKEEY